MSQPFMHPRSIPPGTVVTVPVAVGPLTVSHPGLVTDRLGPDGLPTVINASKRRARLVIEEAWSSFTEGKVANIEAMSSNVSVHEMLRRARADVGRRWDLISANCEHAIRRWRGLPVESPQLRFGVGLVVGVGVVLLAFAFFGRR